MTWELNEIIRFSCLWWVLYQVKHSIWLVNLLNKQVFIPWLVNDLISLETLRSLSNFIKQTQWRVKYYQYKKRVNFVCGKFMLCTIGIVIAVMLFAIRDELNVVYKYCFSLCEHWKLNCINFFSFQNDHYFKSLPHVMQNFQDLDINRIKSFKSLLIKSSDIEKNVYPIILKCLDGVVKAANSINEISVSIPMCESKLIYIFNIWKAMHSIVLSIFAIMFIHIDLYISGYLLSLHFFQDSEAVIEKYKSGFTPPVDIPFEDLSNSSRYQNGTYMSCIFYHHNI